jgi:CheY-like chemotaxis protein
MKAILETEPSPERPLRLLCVDDNLELLTALRIGLSGRGFEVVTATNVAEAFAQFEADQGEFFCVLTDHEMPRQTGADLARQLRSAGYRGRIIVMSASLTRAELSLYQKTSISGFFKKPFSLQMLISMLAEHAGSSKTA